ncbi:phosphatase PAP2 family protein [Nocardioides maradonensis]
MFLGFAALAMSPLGRHVDRLTYLRPLRPGMWGFGLVRGCLDHIASQGGEGIVMATLAVAFAVRMRSSLPLLVAGATEALFYVTGLVKLLFAKDAPRFGAPSYWAGGYVDHGKYGMAFPSGHTSEVVLVFGACVVLLHLAFPGWTAAHARRIKTVWIAVGLNAAVVSWLIGTHWLTDLVAGALFGAVMLRVLVEAVSTGFLPGVAGRVDGVLRLSRPSRAVEPARSSLVE